VHIEKGKIAGYQAVVPVPGTEAEDAKGQRGPYEEASWELHRGSESPRRSLRTVHSFDLHEHAAHVVDARGKRSPR
jgi:Ni,Fe-hydrogenase I large subunit